MKINRLNVLDLLGTTKVAKQHTWKLLLDKTNKAFWCFYGTEYSWMSKIKLMIAVEACIQKEAY